MAQSTKKREPDEAEHQEQGQEAAKRSKDAPAITLVVLDIEGTTTPITFVKDVLFGYVRAKLAAYVEAHSATAAVADAKKHYGANDTDTLVQAVLAAMERDDKAPALKGLQADIMKGGWDDGSLQADVYDDVIDALHRWRAAGTHVAIYSSGAVAAQKALFGHVKGHGSILPLLCAHYDPQLVGPKIVASAYTAIAAQHSAANAILFATDNPLEATAALEAGLRAVLVDRPGNAALPDVPPARIITSFAQLFDTYAFGPYVALNESAASK